MDELYTVDEDPSNRFAFSAFGYILYIQSELVADAIVGLPECEQQILILHYALELPDREVGDLLVYPAAPFSGIEQRR